MPDLKTAPFFTVDIFDDIPGIKHGFFTRQGGVSSGNFDSLNFKSSNGDREENVQQNKIILANSLGITAPQIKVLHQVYGADVITVDENTNFTPQPKGDAIVTNRVGIAVGTKTADCAPVLLACAQTKVIAAVHGMWGCTFKGIIENTVQSMLTLGAERSSIRAAIGPCVAQESYEIDNPKYSNKKEWFYNLFTDQDPSNSVFFSPPEDGGKRYFDLRSYVEHRLKQSGIDKVNHYTMDTYSNPDILFSARRNFQQGNKVYGAQLSVIVRTT